MSKKILVLITVVSLVVTAFTGIVAAGESNYNKRFTYTIDIMDPDIVKADPRYEYIKEKFNVDFEFRPVNWTNWKEKVRIWTASGDMPDIMWLDFQGDTYSEYVNWAKQGAYKPLPEFGDKYPHLQALRDSMKTDDYWEVDGKLYAWPNSMGSPKWRDPLVSTLGFLYRVDWAKKVGLYQEDGNYTWAEMKEMAKAFIEQDPGNNGPGKTIGIAGIGWAWSWFAGLKQTHQLDDFALKDGKYVWAAAQPEFLEGIKETKRLYDQGLLWQDQPIADNNAARSKFIAGQLGIYFTNVNVGDYYHNVLKPMQQANTDLDVYEAVKPMFIYTPKGNYFAEETVDYWSATLFSPKMSDVKLARWLEISDYMASKEGYRLSTIGIKGKDYMIVEDGSINILWPKDDKGNYVSPYDSKAIRFFELTTLHDKFSYNDPAVPKQVREDVKSIVMRNLEDDVYIKPYSYETAWFNGPVYTMLFSRIADTNDKVGELVVSTNSMEELEREWKKYLDSKSTTVNMILEELNKELLNK